MVPILVVNTALAKIVGKPAAIFVGQLAFWLTKTKHTIRNKPWVYNTHQEWADQLGMSERTIKRIVYKLRDLGLIETEKHKRGEWDHTLWYTLDYDKLALLVGPEGYDQWFQKGTISQAKVARSYKEQKITQKSTSEAVVASCSNNCAKAQKAPGRWEDEGMEDIEDIATIEGTEDSPPLTNGESCGSGLGGGMKGSVADIAKGLQKKLEEGPALKNKGPYALAVYWKESVAAKTGEYQDPPSGKVIGQCKNLLKRLPQDLSPKDLVDKVISNWHGFTQKVRLAKGLTVSPDDPSLDYLLVHLQVAIAWATVVKQEVKKVPVTSAINCTVPPKLPQKEKNFNPDAWLPSPKPGA